ncbi:hypothetical protein ACH5RR_019581 [Cinchona calisaya]|uniref:Pectinesterase inhibitor domain-containing protein n=1 Tax=Cinchona calisaya TaxID=153742 RepID=A0ABD2ZTC8_9GENT
MEKYYYNFTKLFNFLTFVLAILSFISLQVQPISSAKTPPSYTNFIKNKCNNTTYPTVCIKTLYPYASYVKTNSIRLCKAALNIAIQGTDNAARTIAKLAHQKGISHIEAAAFKDCIYDVKDEISELKRTLNAMEHLRGADRKFEWANAKTWASAAITDAESCMDGFSKTKVNPAVRTKIRSCLSDEEKLISNALALINHLY